MNWIQNTFYNDMGNWLLYLIVLLYGLGVLIACIAAHELGHAIYFYFAKKRKLTIRFQWNSIWSFKWLAGEPKDYEDLTTKEYVLLNGWGVLAGLVPIIIGMIWLPLTALLIIPYIVGSWKDIKVLLRNAQLED